MKHYTTKDFDALCQKLPPEIQSLIPQCFDKLREKPPRNSLKLKKVRQCWWSARVGAHYRMLGEVADDAEIFWFWVGHHHQYNKILRMR